MNVERADDGAGQPSVRTLMLLYVKEPSPPALFPFGGSDAEGVYRACPDHGLELLEQPGSHRLTINLWCPHGHTIRPHASEPEAWCLVLRRTGKRIATCTRRVTTFALWYLRAIGEPIARGECVERGAVITCTARYGAGVRLPQAGQPGDDWFILELVGRDGGDVAPDGTLACGRYPQRVAPNAYTDPTVNLGGYLQLHDWAGPSCEFSYTQVARRADLDIAARVSVQP